MAFNELDVNILRERIKLLEIENDKLKKENELLKKSSRTSINPKDNKSSVSTSALNKLIPLFNGKTKGCNCKGNCANKICGCMKRNLQCDESCKCNVQHCKNKQQNKENAVSNTPRVRKENQINIPKPATKILHPLGSVSSVDDVFYDATETDTENVSIVLDAAKKLNFCTDEESPVHGPVDLSMIQETDETESRENTRNIDKASKLRKGSATSQSEKQSDKETKINKVKKQTETNSKVQKKGNKLKRTASVEIEPEKEEENLFNNTRINARSRRNKGSVQRENVDIEKVEKKPENTIPEFINLESIKSTGVTSCIKSVSKLKQPKDLNKIKSEEEAAADKEVERTLRSKKNGSFKNIVNKAARALSSDEMSLEAVQSRVQGLRRSVSFIHKTDNTEKRKSLQKSKSVSKESITGKDFNRSLSTENLPKKPLKTLISKVSHTFQKSHESGENKDHTVADLMKRKLTTVKESPKSFIEADTSKEDDEKLLKFDPMQPTRQLSRSPVPGISAVQAIEAIVPASPPIYRTFLDSHDIPVASPPPEILQVLNEEKVDSDELQSKLVPCRKCKRKFFPHRIKLHEAVCHKN